jgi:CDP-diacylglycerol--glycerol-3-phosphate 3-phosphatidyltransferase
MTRPEPPFWNLANVLTLSRLALAPLIFALIVFKYPIAAVAVFLFAAVTDWLDGQAARRLGLNSAIGRQLDPLVDKVLVLGCYIYLLAAVPDSGLAPWMVVAILARELIVQSIRSLIEGRGEPFGAKLSGKLKTVTQFAAIIAVLVVQAYPATSSLRLARDILIWSSVLLTIGSGFHYLVLAWPALAGAARVPNPDAGQQPR